MRRWFELGISPTGNVFTGPFSLNSDRRKSGPRPSGEGPYPAIFFSMPKKERFYEWYSANVTSNLVSGAGISSIMVLQGDQGVDPAGDCSALHIPRQFVGIPGQPSLLFTSPMQAVFGPLIFTETGSFTGNFGPSLFEQISSEPPSENG